MEWTPPRPFVLVCGLVTAGLVWRSDAATSEEPRIEELTGSPDIDDTLPMRCLVAVICLVVALLMLTVSRPGGRGTGR